MAVNDEILDRGVSHAIGLDRYASGVVKKIIAQLQRTEKDLVKQIQRRGGSSGTFTDKRLAALLRDVRITLAEAQAALNKTMAAEMAALADYEATFNQKLIQDELPVDFDVTMPSRQLLKAAVTATPFKGALLKDWVAGLTDGARRRINEAIRQGVVQGETVDQIVRRIRGTQALNYKDGVMATSRRGAEAMVRTAVNGVSTEARELLYDENDDLIKGVRWVSTLDTRTTPICRARDGKVYPPKKGPRPPAHINCRSTTVPVTKSWKELGLKVDEVPEGTRASMNGQVPAGLTYDQWLRQQPVAVQDDVLGKKKADLFRAGLPIDKFVSGTGKPLTIAELAQKDAAAVAAKNAQAEFTARQAAEAAKKAAVAAAQAAAEEAAKQAKVAAAAKKLADAQRKAEREAREAERITRDLQRKADELRRQFFEIEGTLGRVEQLTPMDRAPNGPELDAVRYYTSSGYRPLNKALRKVPDAAPLSHYHVTEVLPMLDRMFSMARLDKDVVLYRAPGQEVTSRIQKMKPGMVLDDDGYVSTSYRKSFINGWSAGRMRIFAAKGQRALLVDPISANEGEREVLLPRGTRLLYLGKSKDGYDEFEILE